MLMRHVTPRYNESSIDRRGLLTAYAQGKRRAVWLIDPDKTSWAILHTMLRHGCGVDDVLVYEVEIPADRMRHHGNGLWYTPENVPSAWLQRKVRWVEVAAAGSVADA